MASKKLVNEPSACVDDSLQGFVALNPGVRLLTGHRVLVRADIEDVRAQNKVTLLSGGGSGHEPAHAGYVGCGMLSAAVAGSVFASPPPSSILAAIKAISSPAGTLLIVKNYTGDRLNFGLAAERAKAAGVRVEMLVVGEDCALTSVDMTAGRRGLAGTVLIHKIAGALAESGKPLQEIVAVCKQAASVMGTIGVCLSPCSIPGHAPNFQLAPDEIELGLGIHGEPGVKRQKIMSTRDTVKVMINHMTNEETSTHIDLEKGSCVALMVNNLGGTSVLEMNIVAKEAIEFLENESVVVERAYCGSYMTSLEMAGVSLTILPLSDTIRACLDQESSAPAWHKSLLAPDGAKRSTPPMMPCTSAPSAERISSHDATAVTPETAAVIHRAVAAACQKLVSCEAQLNTLDASSGDGDCGSTLARGASVILSALGSSVQNSSLPVSVPADLMLSLANICETVMGGSSGALYSLFLTAASSALSHDTSASSWLAALHSGNQAIIKYGNAKPGYRTMLDPLYTAEQALRESLKTAPALESLQSAVQAAEKSAQETAQMKAGAGRSSYVNPELLKEPDPGAEAVAVIMRAVCTACR